MDPAQEGETQPELPAGEVLSSPQSPELQVGLEHPNCQQFPQKKHTKSQQ